jgi:hypothetical protein
MWTAWCSPRTKHSFLSLCLSGSLVLSLPHTHTRSLTHTRALSLAAWGSQATKRRASAKYSPLSLSLSLSLSRARALSLALSLSRSHTHSLTHTRTLLLAFTRAQRGVHRQQRGVHAVSLSLSLSFSPTHTLSLPLTHTPSLSLSLSLSHTHTHTHTHTHSHSLARALSLAAWCSQATARRAMAKTHFAHILSLSFSPTLSCSLALSLSLSLQHTPSPSFSISPSLSLSLSLALSYTHAPSRAQRGVHRQRRGEQGRPRNLRAAPPLHGPLHPAPCNRNATPETLHTKSLVRCSPPPPCATIVGARSGPSLSLSFSLSLCVSLSHLSIDSRYTHQTLSRLSCPKPPTPNTARASERQGVGCRRTSHTPWSPMYTYRTCPAQTLGHTLTKLRSTVLQGYLARKKQPPPQDHHRALDIILL